MAPAWAEVDRTRTIWYQQPSIPNAEPRLGRPK